MMWSPEVDEFPRSLAVELKVSASTQNLLSWLLFLFTKLLDLRNFSLTIAKCGGSARFPRF